jgi:hypothetical protein
MERTQWTVEQLEDAYMSWAYEHGHNLAATSRSTGIPLRTLQYHKARARWDERYSAETAEVADFALGYGLDELRLGISAAALQLVKDASNDTLLPSERLASQKLLFSLLVHNPEGHSYTGPQHISLIDARRVELPASPDPQSISSRAIEQNLAASRQLQGSRRMCG